MATPKNTVMLPTLNSNAHKIISDYHLKSMQPFLDNLAIGCRMGHAWLLYGTSGTELQIVAEFMAAKYLTTMSDIPQAQNWEHIHHNTHPDTMILEKPNDKTIIPVDNVRYAMGFLSKTPSLTNGKVLIIKNADILNHNGANALLKKLEEPPKNTLILLTAKAIGALPITVRSRCWKLRFMGLSRDVFLSCLNNASNADYELYGGNLEAVTEPQPSNLLLKINDAYKEIIEIANNKSNSGIIEKIDNLDTLINWQRDSQLLHLDAAAVAIAT